MLSAPSAFSPINHIFPQCRPQFRHPLSQFSKFPAASSTTPDAILPPRKIPLRSQLSPRASVGSAELVVEPGTDVKFPRELTVPGCSESMVLLGTGFREKVFAIIGVKVYAAGFYTQLAIREALSAWKGKPGSEILDDSSLFSSIFQAPLGKSLMIVLVRDVSGKTFWNALDDVISSRIQDPTSIDETALSTFRETFQKRDLKQGTSIFLTWVESSKMLVRKQTCIEMNTKNQSTFPGQCFIALHEVSISSSGLPSKVDATIESLNVTSALFDAFFGSSPVSPTLKISAANGFKELLS